MDMTHKGYTAQIEYSPDDGCLVGRIAGIRDIISFHADSVQEIRQMFIESVDEYLEHCKNIGKEPNKPYSGRFVLRIDPVVHARLAMKAQAHGMSLNQYAAQVLAQA